MSRLYKSAFLMIVVALFVGLANPLMAQPPKFTGVWDIHLSFLVLGSSRSLVTFHDDNTVLVTGNQITTHPTLGTLSLGNGHGVWRRTSPSANVFEFKALAFAYQIGDPVPVQIYTLEGELSVNNNATVLGGTVDIEILTIPGNLLFTDSGGIPNSSRVTF